MDIDRIEVMVTAPDGDDIIGRVMLFPEGGLEVDRRDGFGWTQKQTLFTDEQIADVLGKVRAVLENAHSYFVA